MNGEVGAMLMQLDDQAQGVISRAARSAMDDRRVRQGYGIGILGWLFAIQAVVALVIRLIELFQESRAYVTPRVGYEALSQRSKADCWDLDVFLVGHLHHAELGGFPR